MPDLKTIIEVTYPDNGVSVICDCAFICDIIIILILILILNF